MSQQFPKISIVTPSLNQAQFLEATITSVISQNYSNLEYIIIDGGSTDGSVEIIKKYEKYLYFWCSEADEGHYDAINKGFAHSTGEIMAWLNSDDMYFPWTFRTVASIMVESSQVQWLTTLSPCFWDWQGFCIKVDALPGYAREAFLDGYYLASENHAIGWIQQESTFWRRGLWEKVGGSIQTEYALAGDFDLWARFYKYADLYGTRSPLGGFRSQSKQRGRMYEQQYITEAKNSLAVTREYFGWSPKWGKRVFQRLHLDRVPLLQRLIYFMYVYTAKSVVRENIASPDGYWAVKKYKFYR